MESSYYRPGFPFMLIDRIADETAFFDSAEARALAAKDCVRGYRGIGEWGDQEEPLVFAEVTHKYIRADRQEPRDKEGFLLRDRDYVYKMEFLEKPVSPEEIAHHQEGHLADIADADFDRLQAFAEQVDKLLDQILPQCGRLAVDIGLLNGIAIECREVRAEAAQ